jgi:hypothetical protein
MARPSKSSTWQERYADGLLAVGGGLLCVFLALPFVTWWSATGMGIGALLMGVGFSLKPSWHRWKRRRDRSASE